MRHSGRVLCVLTALLMAALPTAAADAAAPTSPQAVITADFPDPDVIRVGSTFYAYSTSSSGRTVPVASAPSASGPWTIRGEAMPDKPSWVGCIQGDCGWWAPDVSRRADGRYLMYFSAPSPAAGRRCIGAAVASGPLGPFRPLGNGPVTCNPSEGGAIDPSSLVDAHGKRYLLYKNDGNAVQKPAILWLQQVGADGVTLVGARKELLRNGPGEDGVVEAPVLVKRPTGYVLFYSAGNYGTDRYHTRYATSPSLTGPYTKADKPLMTTEGLGGAVHGPGGADVLDDRIFFHGWAPGRVRWMYTANLDWVNGRPVVQGSRAR
ncbi:glycoside hydrolase family 43 protein [Thermopolyspora sp. NPDC052614]|uniref:glycoside hydrolase family 43 protein n=1 Tax=Thermopolyspora sp. NPDC052614 TaxID=3155682 RepID=UPI003429DB10